MSRAASVSCAVLIPLLAAAAAGQVLTANWDNVRMIAAGTDVRVAADNSKPIQGKLDSITDNNLVIKQGTGTQSFVRAEIHSVGIRRNGHRLRKVLIGIGVGTAAGLAIGGATANNCTGIGCGGMRVATGGLVGLIGGMITGLVWSSGEWRQVYAQ
ncbi:MAG: hypothetical protein LAO55_06645 [Acidobacteriia bacterium]|nr:hypothetical protein [Terriglobia bacterium]